MENKLFCYVADFGSVTGGSTYPATINFDTDSDFFIKAVRSDKSSTTLAKITIQKDGGEQLSSAAFEVGAVAGANNALNFFEDIVVRRGSKWSLSAVCGGGTAQPLQLQFWGFKK